MPTLIWKPSSFSEKSFSTLKAMAWQLNVHPYSWSPPTDVYETEDNFIIKVEVAGLRESDFSINFEGNNLVINGIRSDCSEKRAYHQMEIRFGEFSIDMELPSCVDSKKTVAEYENGFLTIIISKSKSSEIHISR